MHCPCFHNVISSIIVPFYKLMHFLRVPQPHATQAPGLRPHVPQTLMPPRQMKVRVLMGLIIRVETWAGSAEPKEKVCPSKQKKTSSEAEASGLMATGICAISITVVLKTMFFLFNRQILNEPQSKLKICWLLMSKRMCNQETKLIHLYLLGTFPLFLLSSSSFLSNTNELHFSNNILIPPSVLWNSRVKEGISHPWGLPRKNWNFGNERGNWTQTLLPTQRTWGRALRGNTSRKDSWKELMLLWV